MLRNTRLKDWEHTSNEARPKIRFWVPAAAMDEDDLRDELKLLHERGFGGVEVVALLATTPAEIVAGEDGWGTEHWNRMVEVIAETTSELGMTMDLANGPMWPISMPTVQSADDPAALHELTYGVIESPQDGQYYGQVPQRRTQHDEGTPVIVHVMAYLENVEGQLIQNSYVDLSASLTGTDDKALLDVTLPIADEGTRWLIFVFYSQPAAQKTGNGQYYVIDHLSKEGVLVCEQYWTPILQKYNHYPSMESFFCDSLEYSSVLDWTPKFPEEFQNRRGYSILPYLPFIGYEGTYPASEVPGYQFDNPNISDMVNNDYFETLTQCYCENHLAELERMAQKFGKTIRYQVAYNKPFEGERSALYVSIPENEALGRPAMDFQKTMAAAAHLGRKKRYSFECAAEFSGSYGQDYEDLFWWVKRSLMSGMNAQVMHGASYSGAYHGKYSRDGSMEGVQWPGYEAFQKVVSNYWNRTLSIEDARGCIDTIARMNTVFLKKAKVDCAIYRASYQNNGEASEFCFYQDNGLLANHGYTYETVSPTLLELPVCKIEDGLLDREGVGYKCLIVPEQKVVSYSFLLKVKEMLDHHFPVIWIGEKPEHAMYYAEWKDGTKREEWKVLINQIWEDHRLSHVATNEQVLGVLRKHSIRPNVELEGKMNLVTATREDEANKITYYAVYGYNLIQYTPDDPNPDELAVSAIYKKGTTKGSYQRPGDSSRKIIAVSLNGEGQVYQCNPWSGELTPIDFKENNGRTEGYLSIEEDELVILAMLHTENKVGTWNAKKQVENHIEVNFHQLQLEAFEPNTIEEKSFLRSTFATEKRKISIQELLPWNELDSALEKFAGRGTYYGTIHVEQKLENRRYILCLGEVSDTFQICINDRKTVFADQVLKEVDITEEIQAGDNQLKVIVHSNLYNRLNANQSDSKLPFTVPYVPKNYGIWESEGKTCKVKVIK